MPSTIASIETTTRLRLNEITPRFWSSVELVDIIIAGVRDLWRDIVDLKQEHYLTVDTNVYLGASSSVLSNVPKDVHKIYLIEPLLSTVALNFIPMDYNHHVFQGARGSEAVTVSNGGTVYFCITGQGAPVNAPVIYVAPQVSTLTNLSFSYVPSLGVLTADSRVPIPGEADNALVAWTVAYARAKEREDRSPDPAWIQVYSTEKQHLLQSLGLRQYQEASIAEALFEEHW